MDYEYTEDPRPLAEDPCPHDDHLERDDCDYCQHGGCGACGEPVNHCDCAEEVVEEKGCEPRKKLFVVIGYKSGQEFSGYFYQFNVVQDPHSRSTIWYIDYEEAPTPYGASWHLSYLNVDDIDFITTTEVKN